MPVEIWYKCLVQIWPKSSVKDVLVGKPECRAFDSMRLVRATETRCVRFDLLKTDIRQATVDALCFVESAHVTKNFTLPTLLHRGPPIHRGEAPVLWQLWVKRWEEWEL
jgi:hypothetical protein